MFTRDMAILLNACVVETSNLHCVERVGLQQGDQSVILTVGEMSTEVGVGRSEKTTGASRERRSCC